MKKINTFIFLFISILLSGCASIDSGLMVMGPYKENYLEKLILESIPSKNDKTILFSPGHVSVDRKGMKDRRPIVTNSAPTQIPGILVLTDKNILLQQWDKEKLIYKNVWKISLDEINSISFESVMAYRGISALLKNDRYVTFEFGANWNDHEVVGKAFVIMTENLKSSTLIKP